MEERGSSACFCFEHPGLFRILFNKFLAEKETRACMRERGSANDNARFLFTTRRENARYVLSALGGP